MIISGGITPTALNIAGSLAASQRVDADVDRMKSDAAGKQSQASQTALASDKLADVGETEMSADRDADGTLFYSESETSESPLDAADDEPLKATPARSFDADGERGRQLDLDA